MHTNNKKDCDTCADESYNPKRHRQGKASVAFGDVYDVLQEELSKLDRTNLVYGEWPIVPFYDKGDAYLQLFRKLKDYSVTHGSIINKKIDYGLGGGLVIENRQEPGFKLNKEKGDIPEQVRQTFFEFIKSFNPGYTGAKLLKDIRCFTENYLTYGNAFMRLDLVEVGELKFAYITNIDAEKCRYMAKEDPTLENTLFISDDFEKKRFYQEPPTAINVYPDFSELSPGHKATVIHVKRVTPGRSKYGLYSAITSLRSQLLEIKIADKTLYDYETDFTGRVFAELSGNMEPKDKNDIQRTIEAAYRRDGKGKKFMLRFKGNDDADANIHEFKANASHQFNRFTKEDIRADIIISHDWHKDLITSTQGRLGNSNNYSQILTEKMLMVVRPLVQEVSMYAANTLLDLAKEFLGYQSLEDYTLGAHNSIEEILIKENETAVDDSDVILPPINQNEDGDAG